MAAVSGIWSRLILTVGKTQDRSDQPSTTSSGVEQTENSRKRGTIWEAVRKADQPAMEGLVQKNPSNVDARGPVGECPIHMMFLYGTETHLNMARYIITHFPHTITQTYAQGVDAHTAKAHICTEEIVWVCLGLLR